MTAPTETIGLVPNFDRQPGQRFDIRGHGTEARARRERRAGQKPCEPCRLAENAANAYRWRGRRAAAAGEVPADGS